MNFAEKIKTLKTRLILFLSILLISIAIAVPFSIHFFSLGTDLNNRLHYLSNLSNEVKYQDEVLSMSALAAATTKDPKWKIRYDKHELILESILNEASVTDPIVKELIEKTAEANDKLITLESQAFKLMQQDRHYEALAILSGSEYLLSKEKYSLGIDQAMKKMRNIAEEDLITSYRSWAKIFISLVMVFLIAFTVLWFYLIRYMSTTDEVISGLITKDDLSGLLNRRTFNEELEKELNRSQRGNYSLTLALFDLDNFKAYNDNYGHPKGDEAIALVGDILNHCARRSDDFVFRIGGEEFVLIGHFETTEKAAQHIEHILNELRNAQITHDFNEGHGILTASVGLANTTNASCASAHKLYQCADQALYQAKRLGRNRIEAFS